MLKQKKNRRGRLHLAFKTSLTLLLVTLLSWHQAPTLFAQDPLPATVQTFYVPVPNDQAFASMDAIFPGNDICATDNVPEVALPIINYISMAAAADNTVIYYDHSEDGYEVDVTTPSQTTTEIWGDGDTQNGFPPGFSDDLINAGDVIILHNSSSVDNVSVSFDGGDKFESSKTIAVTRALWSTGPNTLLAGALEVYDTVKWGTHFRIPVGQDLETAVDQDIFEYVGLHIMAREANTAVSLDADADGTFETTITLNEGESYHQNGAVHVGAAINADKPVQVSMPTGDVCATYESRWFTLIPEDQWSSDTYVPTSTQPDDATVIFLFNPHSDPINIQWETTAGPQPNILLNGGMVATQTMPALSGAHFFTANEQSFAGIAVIDADIDGAAAGSGTSADWGFALPPDDVLSHQALIGLGLGRDPTAPYPIGDECSQPSTGHCPADPAPLPPENGNPVWVTPVCDTYVYVDLNNDGTPDKVDLNGDRDTLDTNVDGFNETTSDQGISIQGLESIRLFDPDGDQTGLIVYSLDAAGGVGNLGCQLAVSWGQDPGTASPGAPGIDIGTTVPPLPVYEAGKGVELITDTDNNGQISPGDVVQYAIVIRNLSRVPIPDVLLQDTVPDHTTYVAGSTTFDNGVSTISIPDAGTTAFPLDEGDFNLGTMPTGGEFIVAFNVTLNDAPNACHNTIYNQAQVTALSTETLPEVSTPFSCSSDIDIEVTTNGHDADQPPGVAVIVGDLVTWDYLVTNTGDVDLADVIVTDDQLGQICTIANLAVGASTTCTAEGIAQEGQYSNTGQAVGSPITPPDQAPLPNVTDTDPSHYLGNIPNLGCSDGVYERVYVHGLGMGNRDLSINPQQITVNNPAEVNALLGQLAGRSFRWQPEKPEQATFSSALENIILTTPDMTVDSDRVFIYESDLQPTEMISGELQETLSVHPNGHRSYAMPRSFVLYETRQSAVKFINVIHTQPNDGFVYQGHGKFTYQEILEIPPLPDDRAVFVTAVVIDNDEDARVLNVTASAADRSQSYEMAGPNAGSGLNIVRLKLDDVPSGTDTVIVELESPPSIGDSGVLVGVVVSYACDQDSDGDNLPDPLEDVNGDGNLSNDDSDGDGIPNYLDPDDDGDTVSTIDEDLNGDLDPRNDDTDEDGTPNYLDPDDDNDTFPTIDEDLDGDGDPTNDDFDHDDIPNYLDPDDDNDGLPSDTDDDPLGADTDGDGINDSIEGDDDPDNDDIPNDEDLDSDGDGILDSVEGVADVDNDTVPNYLDLDSDGDSIGDADEWSEDIADPITNCTVEIPICFNNDADGDGLDNYVDTDSDNDDIPDILETADDSDSDGVPNYLDLDSDNDGITDYEETSNGIDDALQGCLDPLNDICFNNDVDGDGIDNLLDQDSDADGVSDADEGITDVDGDDIANYLDANDNDGPLGDLDEDTVLNGDEIPFDFDGDGLINELDPDDDDDTFLTIDEDVDGDGNPSNDDTDGDGIPNYLDPDDDNDGILTEDEVPGDTDGDGIPNHLDPDDSLSGQDDTDGDTVLNGDELDEDTDGDGLANLFDPDDDGDTIPTADEDANGDGNPLNDDTDADGIPDYLDADDDGDGIPTSDEGDGDTDGDGLPDYLDPDDDNDGTPTQDELPGDTDGDGIPNHLDPDDDLSQQGDEDGDTVLNGDELAEDTDSDGFDNMFDPDDDGDSVPTANEDPNGDANPLNDDTDGDGIPNYLDTDDDNDSLLTIDEDVNGDGDPTNDDTDNDGTPNYLDSDDDGDGIPTIDEGTGDADGDGIPNHLDDTDDSSNPDHESQIFFPATFGMTSD